MKRISPLDAAWLMLESRDTPMHVGGLFEFTRPPGAGEGFLAETLEKMRQERNVPPPWNLTLVDGPVVGHRLPLMREDRDVVLKMAGQEIRIEATRVGVERRRRRNRSSVRRCGRGSGVQPSSGDQGVAITNQSSPSGHDSCGTSSWWVVASSPPVQTVCSAVAVIWARFPRA